MPAPRLGTENLRFRIIRQDGLAALNSAATPAP